MLCAGFANLAVLENIGPVMKFRFCALFVAVVVSLATANTLAKVPPRKPVPPVESNGIRYAADGDGSDQYVAAIELVTGKQLWRVRVFHTHIKPWHEPDVQVVVITELKLVDGSLPVRDRKARCYAVDVRDHRVSKVACSSAFASDESLRQ
jgi:hypothetical protein